MSRFEKIVCNLQRDGQVRHEILENRDHLVVPCVMIKEGVLNGSQGAGFYPKEEMQKAPQLWNHKPVVIYHPSMGGQAISACEPAVLNTQKVGVLLNTRMEDDKLKTEAWLDTDRLFEVDNRVSQNIIDNVKTEVSTGLSVEPEFTKGDWNGQQYDWVARNFKPDHLAILPDKIGACSVKDGAGLLQNESSQTPSLSLVEKATRAYYAELGMIENEMSYENIRESISMKVREKWTGVDIWVVAVYDDFFILEKEGKLYKVTYTIPEDNPKNPELGAELIEVERYTEYRTVEGNVYVGNLRKDNKMDKKAFVAALIANENTAWSEEDKDVLLAMNEATLKKLEPVQNDDAGEEEGKEEDEQKTAVQNAAEKGAAGVQPDDKVENTQAESVTAEQYVANAPAGIRDMLGSAMDMHNQERSRLIDTITQNDRNGFTKEDLQEKPMRELQMIANLAANAPKNSPRMPVQNNTVDYSGLGGARVENKDGETTEEPLAMPVMNFGKDD